ncbi:TPA: GtrA family protein [Streptococcus equi subsp. zooepidemicus]|uniref:GtrA-like protein n=1 Tax=Streptococcus equi subsp. ruminatorum CECT 5772 TaxID=1051981 RepID=A0A922NTH2_9STRE|nr:GtrA family protein [Streptococcus equi]HEL0245966.1 GtrA family protein [Streptococcus equi subsp. zooepidemicus]HEL1011103.1 GtrA family protein [Streptococcus equi subsp. ruminatorum]KED03914.1 GtrA-like protein [Streptococcus equi subsp. ruminatorum CECT 5772]HEL1013071.1 GtrA family protein [Streptococcus equi subsp. ruminatorum]HEL1023003.1 GtrA family protein [Streptococcus equi subsp. ruminatorum CECT 5772]
MLSKQKLSLEIIHYLISGLLTTILYFVLRYVIYSWLHQVTISAGFANVIAIIAAFLMNDSYVFKQTSDKRLFRFAMFFLARVVTLGLDMLLAYLLVEKYPEVIGSLVEHDSERINSVESILSQALMVSLNFAISKYYIFKRHRSR